MTDEKNTTEEQGKDEGDKEQSPEAEVEGAN